MRALAILSLLLLIAGSAFAQEKISRSDRAKMRETRETLTSLRVDLATLQGMNDEYPKTLKELVDNNLREGVPKDAWGRELVYELSVEKGFTLTSWGADGKPGGDGAARDIVWTPKGELREMSADERAEYEARLDESRFQATRMVARARMVKVGVEVVDYRRNNDKWPTNLEDCKRKGESTADHAINRCFTDPFGHQFGLRLLPHDNFAIVCWGQDGKEDGLERDSDFVITDREVRANYNKQSFDPWGWGNYDDTDWQVRNLADDIQRYKQQFGALPEELNDLTRGGKREGDDTIIQPIRSTLPRDRWGNDYVYVKFGEEEFFIVGLGKDGIEGGVKDNKDDIYPKPGVDPTDDVVEDDWGGPVVVKPQQDDNDVLVEVANELMLDLIDKLKAYHAENGKYPDSLDAIKDKLVGEAVPLDPWEHAFVYTLIKGDDGNVTGFTLTCHGSDGVEGGDGHAADITLNQDSEPMPAGEDGNAVYE